MIILIDNYDSFTYNLVHYFGEIGNNVTLFKNDEKNANDLLDLKPKAIVISPGPCNPNKAGVSLDITKKAALKKIPILGVCLGHQTIGQVFGAKIIAAKKIVHGKTDKINHICKGIFNELPSPFNATRYHSLIVENKSLPSTLEITATTDDQIIMEIQQKKHPIFGVQFHPESIMSEHGHKLLKNFKKIIESIYDGK